MKKENRKKERKFTDTPDKVQTKKKSREEKNSKNSVLEENNRKEYMRKRENLCGMWIESE